MAKRSLPQRVIKSNPATRDVNAAQRVSLALNLRASKVTYQSIADQCGYSSAGACRQAVLREMERVIVSDVDELRREENATLDLLQQECMTLFLDKDNRNRLHAADRLLAIMERRAKLLGLDATSQEQILNQNYTKRIILVAEETHAGN